MTASRRLAAILAADVAGYSRLMGIDEEGTLERLKAHRRELIDPKIAEHHGRIVKTTGDGMLVEFGSVVDAVRCAVEVQQRMSECNADVPRDHRIEFRVGINLGDIIIDGDDIHGDGVNIAARLEALAEPGTVCISGTAYDHVRDKLDYAFEDRGDQTLKNIARPVRVYRITVGAAILSASAEKPTLALPSKPSIAVLPFTNMSGDPEQEYFADGMVEEITAALSRVRSFFVIARNSTFTYKGKAVRVQQVSQELGVRYVLEGSVRKAGDRVRITAQLIDATTGNHIWSDRYDGKVEDIFALQDRITESVVGAIEPKLREAEIERVRRKPTASLDAYDYFLRGIAKFHTGTRENADDALKLFLKAIELDPGYAAAYGMAAWCHQRRRAYGWTTDLGGDAAEARRLAWRAVETVADDPLALAAAGFALANGAGEVETGAAIIDRALKLNQNDAVAWTMSGWTQVQLGNPEIALEHFSRALHLSPLDPLHHPRFNGIAFAHFVAGRYEEAVAWSEKRLREFPDSVPALRLAAAVYGILDRDADADKIMVRLRKLQPGITIAIALSIVSLRREADRAAYAMGLRKAGLPEE